MDPDYGTHYVELFHHHWWWRAREAVVLEEIRRLRDGAAPTRILDVGCGDGLFFHALGEFGIVEGVEPDASLLTPDSEWATSIAAVPFDDRFRPPHRYGLILFLDVLEHIENPVAALRTALGLLDDDGAIIITVPAFRWLWTSHDDFNHHFTRYERQTLRHVVADAGGRVEHDRYLFQWLVPAKLLVRAWERIARSIPTPERTPAAPINRALLHYTRAELRLARALNPSFGSSVFAVVRRSSGP